MNAPMQPLDYYKKAWAEIQPDLVGWIVFYTVFIGLSIVTCGLAGVLLPNVMRQLRDSHREGRGPDLAGLFDMRRAVDDLVNYLLWFGAITVGSAAGGIGGTIAAIALQMQMPLAADGRYAPIDNARISLKHVGAHMGDHVVFMLIATGISMVAVMLCLLPLPIIAPVLGMATWLWYEDVQAELDTLAAQGGIKQLSGGQAGS